MISPVKIILLIVVVAAVYLASRIFRKGVEQGEATASKKDGKGGTKDNAQTDLVKCPECDTFVASLEDHSCKR